MMVLWDIENKVGLEIARAFRRHEVKPIYEEPSEKDHLTVFFPDPFYLTLRTIDLPFGGVRAKKACEVEIASLEMFQGNKYVIWTPRKGGTSVAIIYEPDYIQELVKKGVKTILFKPICLLHLCEAETVVVDVGNETVSIASRVDKDIFRIAFFRYDSSADIRDYVMLFLGTLKNKDVRFKVCGRGFHKFPFGGEIVRPSDAFGVAIEDPAFTSLFCAAFGRYPDVKISFAERSVNLEALLQRSLGVSIFAFFAITLVLIPYLFELRYLKRRTERLLNETHQIFSSVFPDTKAVDPYSQLRAEYARLKRSRNESCFDLFAKFAEAVSPYTIRIEDFSIDSDEVSAQMKIREISDVQKIKEKLDAFLKDVRVTSTIRSREGDSYIMRISGRI